MPKNSNIKNDSDWKMRFLDCAVIQTVYKANENEPFLMKLGIKLVKIQLGGYSLENGIYS